jgi:hypothetical protein
MIIYKSIDIEEEVRTALSPHQTAYCRPLPADYSLPNILVTQVGGTDTDRVDTFEVVLDSRAETEAEALSYLNMAKAILIQTAKEQTTALRHVTINTSGSWGADPVRPDLAMCSARIAVTAHRQIVEV